MSVQSLGLPPRVQDYMLSVSLRETPLLRRLREETSKHPYFEMQIAPEQGQFMALLVELIAARRVLEVGTFTGYSALSMAQSLPSDGQLITCDINQEWTAVARRYWDEAGVGDRIQLRLGPATETLDSLLDSEGPGSFDLAFIDADKENYTAYYERSLKLLRQGGLILIDNVLWSGRVADPSVNTSPTNALRELNQALHQDQRISLSMIPVADGLTLAYKR
jgi:predicted O-methyltransferase YrrM